MVGPSRYTVKQVSELTGVPPATLRAWERRYAVVAPQRSDSRYRLYDEEDVSRLTRMAELVRQGSPASLAADHVRLSMAAPSSAAAAVTAPDAPPPPVEDLVRAGQTYDQSLLTALLDDAFARASFEVAVERWLIPALTAVGEAWERGELDVSGEHFVSAAVHRRLAVAFDAAGLNTGAPVALVGLPPGAFHALGALAFAVCLRRLGVDVRFLGADVPTESWTLSVQTLHPAAVVVSVPMPGDARAAAGLVRALAGEESALWLGGRGGDATAERLRRGSGAGTPPVEFRALPESVVEAAVELATVLHGR